MSIICIFVSYILTFIKSDLFNNISKNLCSSSNIVGYVVIIFSITFVFFWYKRKIKFNERYFRICVIIVLFSGWIIYAIGFNNEGTSQSILALLFRPLLSSLEMFVSHSDLLEVDIKCHNNALYMTVFSLIHFSAVMLSAIFAVHYLGMRITSWIRYNMLMIRRSKIDDLYIFLGIDDHSTNLAKDIHNTHDNQAIVFIEMSINEEFNHERLSFHHLFGHFTYRRELLDIANDCKAILMRCIYESSNESKDLIRQTGLYRLMRKSHRIYFFMLSDNENVNVKMAISLTEYDSIMKINELSYHPKIKIYCRARKNNENAKIELINKNGVTVKIIDTSNLAILSLKSCPNYQPANFIDIDTDKGIAKSDLNAMVIGFGETGQDALNFIYEFGQFPYENESEQHFRCIVIDKCMDRLKADFIMNAPAMGYACSGIEYYSMNIHSEIFWNLMKSIINKINYIVIAVGNDNEGLELAINLHEFALRYRDFEKRSGRFSNFKIFIRVYNVENEKRIISITKQTENVISIFGEPSKLFTKRLIIENQFEHMGIKFFKTYASTIEKRKLDGSIDEIDFKRNEEERAKFIKCYNTTITEILTNLSLIRKKTQDKSNAYHMYTKSLFISANIMDEMLTIINKINPDSDIDTIVKNCMKKPYFLNLCKCEHKRWNASHYTLGYTKMLLETYRSNGDNVTCDLLHKQHACLVPWELLPQIGEQFQNYDGYVVFTTFTILLNNIIDEQ